MAGKGKYEPDPSGVKFSVFWLTPGITRINAASLLFSGFSLIGIVTFVAIATPYLVQEALQIPKDEQGSLIGTIVSLHELIVIVMASFIGASSDKLGRRLVFVIGLCWFAVGMILYPLATTPGQLIGLRIFYAFGFAGATVMLHVCLAEYTQDATRGRWLGAAGMLNGLGVTLVALLFSQMPQWYIAAGYDSVMAIRFSFWTFAGFVLALALWLRLFLAPPGVVQKKNPDRSLKVLIAGFAAARENKRILLSYGMAFASRGDLAILTTFFSLWLIQTGNDLGMSTAESMAKAGMLFGLSQGVGLLWSYPIGLIIDRLNRMTAMCIAFGIATVGYFALGFIIDPFGKLVLIACMLAGMGESSAMIAGGVLVGQEAPARHRGAVLGTYSLMGAAGIMMLTFVGGQLFDLVGNSAPFIMMGCINFIVFCAALYLRRAEVNVETLIVAPPETPD
jgi:MFS family permease